MKTQKQKKIAEAIQQVVENICNLYEGNTSTQEISADATAPNPSNVTTFENPGGEEIANGNTDRALNGPAGGKDVGIDEAQGGSWNATFYKASEGWGWDDSKSKKITISSLEDLRKLADTDNCGKLVIDFNYTETGVDVDIMLYDDYIE